MAQASGPSFGYKDANSRFHHSPAVPNGLDLRNGFILDSHSVTANAATIYGGDTSGDDLYLYANTADSGTHGSIILSANGHSYWIGKTGLTFIFQEQGSNFLTLNRSGSTYTADNTAGTAWDFVLATTGGDGVQINGTTVTTGRALSIVMDSDLLTTGKAMEVLGGSARGQSWFQVIENSADTEGCQVVIDGSNAAGAASKPSLKLGVGENGFYIPASNQIGVALAGAINYKFTATDLQANDGAGPSMINEAATATNPTFAPNRTDLDTGLGWAAADQLSLIAGGVEGMRIVESGGVIRTELGLEVGSGDTNYVLHAGTAVAGGGFRLTNTGGNTNHTIQRDTASSADGDVIGGWYFNARDDGDAESEYARITAEVQDPAAAAEEGILRMYATEDGAATEYLRLDASDGVASVVMSKKLGLNADLDVSTDITVGGHSDGQVFHVNNFQYPNPGTDWTPQLEGAYLGANLAAKKIWIPLNFLKVGDEITTYNLVGDVTEATAATLDCKLVRVNKADPITTTDLTNGAITQVTADGNFDSTANVDDETVATDKMYVLEITGTCGAGDSIIVMGAEVTINRKV